MKNVSKWIVVSAAFAMASGCQPKKMESQKEQNQEQQQNQGGCGCKSKSETSSSSCAPVEKVESAPAETVQASVDAKTEEAAEPLSIAPPSSTPVVQETAVQTPAVVENNTSLSAPLSEMKGESATPTTTSALPVESPAVPAAAAH